jgi:hypothetical protein
MTGKPAPAAALTWSGVTARRMARHALAAPATDLGPAGVAGVLCGAHAQVLSAAELSIGRRIAGATRTDVQRALWAERTLVKTFGPRGTIHLLPSADLPMWTGALSALPSSVPAHPEGVRFTPGEADQVIAAIGDVLVNAELTVDELTEAIADRAGPWAVEETMAAFQGMWPRWRQLTSTAAHRGMLCFGPDRGRKVTYTHPQRWLPGFRPTGGDTALRTLLMRYLYAYGPATPQHFAKWLNIPPGYAAGLFTRLAGGLERVDCDGVPGWTLAGDTGAPPGPHRGIRLLPYFDSYVVAVPAQGPAVPGRGRRPRAYPVGPGRELPGAAGRRRGRRGVAPAALRPQAGHHRGAAARADRGAATAAQRRGGSGEHGHGGDGDADRGHRDGRRARLRGAVPSREACSGLGEENP